MTERQLPTADAQNCLIEWYRAHRRDLPWRHTRDPYRILVSEIMLQQTQAERVVPKYQEFLALFPTIVALADAPVGEVIRAWSGLGYNRRAVNLQRACRTVMEHHGGVMPSDPADLARLPGIGPYTAGAVACFAFESDVAFVDTNIRRVIHRVVAGPEIPEPALTEREVVETAWKLIPPGRGYEWNQALMELGATICRSRVADCERCPLGDHCRSRPIIQAVLAMPRKSTKPTDRFETTSRYFRGRIVEALRGSSDGMTVRDLGSLLKSEFSDADAAWIVLHVEGLMRDHLVVKAARVPARRVLQEDAPTYDDGALTLDDRVQLPD